MTDPNWVFHPVGKGGELEQPPEQDAFDNLGVENFVRESLQNSNDAIKDYHNIRSSDDRKGTVKYGISRVNAKYEDNGRPTSFLKAMGWKKLEQHIKSQPENTIGVRTDNYVEQLSDKMRILTVEDRNAIGLTGQEKSDLKEDTRFADLLRNVRFGVKPGEDAGGHHGMGKAVYWAFSGLSTVFFNSVLGKEPGNKESPRFIGRSKLSSHEVQNQIYSGSGYFGKEGESVWGEKAAEIAGKLHMGRKSVPGTTIMIPGFESPRSATRIEDSKLEKKIRKSVARNFWPAIERKDLDVFVDYEEEKKVDINSYSDINPFIQCYRAYRNNTLQDDLNGKGDVTARTFEVPLPDYKKGKKPDGIRRSNLPDKAEVTLIVRLAKEEDSEELQNRLAKFRGPGMVINPDYERMNGISGARPFHAVLVAGTSRDKSEITHADEELEKVLRKSEPISHDEWAKTSEDLRNTYENDMGSSTGYRATTDTLMEKTIEKIRDLVVEEVEGGEPGPYMLRKRLKVRGGSGPTDRGPKPLSLSEGEGSFEDGRWSVRGKMALNKDAIEGDPSWRAELEMVAKGEDDEEYDKISVAAEPSTNNLDVDTTAENGKAVLDIPSGIDEVEFKIRSEELESEPVKVGLNADAESTEVEE